jgi:sialidase-1
MLTKVDIFEARKGGYHTYRIPGIVVARSGVVLAYGEARKNGAGDWVDIDIILRRGVDNGATWESPKILVDAGEKPAHNATAIVDRETGVIHFLYCINYARAFYMRSVDEGASFSEPVEITSVFEQFHSDFLWNVIGTGPGHGIQFRNGRLVVPVWLSNGGRRHRPSAVSVIYSDDHGATWKRGDMVPNTLLNMSETVAVQLADGFVLFNIRNEDREHRRAVSISKDGATKWSRPVFDQALREPICMGNIIRYSESPSRIIFSNPDNLEYSGKHGTCFEGNRERKNLTIKMSCDECKTWLVSKVLEPGISGYSDLAVGSDGSIFCSFERDGVDGVMWDTKYITVARFDLDWLTKGL